MDKIIRLSPFREANFEEFISWIDGEELLITIAGDAFTFPLTTDQLERYLDNESSKAFNIVDVSGGLVIGHAEIVASGTEIFKIDKLIIGNAAERGKGIGQQVIAELLNYAFTLLNAKTVELNVFDWNTAGIRCYEKCGFKINPEKVSTFKCGSQVWKTLNMFVNKSGLMHRKIDKQQ